MMILRLQNIFKLFILRLLCDIFLPNFRSSSLSDTQSPGYTLPTTTTTTNQSTQEETTDMAKSKTREPDTLRQETSNTKSTPAVAVTAALSSSGSKEGSSAAGLQKLKPKQPVGKTAAVAAGGQPAADKRKTTTILAAGALPVATERGRKSTVSATEIQRKVTTTGKVKATELVTCRPTSTAERLPLQKRDSVGGSLSAGPATKKTSSSVIAAAAAIPAKGEATTETDDVAASTTDTNQQHGQPATAPVATTLSKSSKAVAQKKSTVVDRKPNNATKKASVERQQQPLEQPLQQQEGDATTASQGAKVDVVVVDKRRTSVAVKSSSSLGPSGRDKRNSQLTARPAGVAVDRKHSAEEVAKSAKPKLTTRPLPQDSGGGGGGGGTSSKKPRQFGGEVKSGPNKNASLEPAMGTTTVTPAGGGPAPRTHHRPIEKSDSSVSFTRKKFEKKVENNEETTRTVEGTRKLTEPLMPRLKISQNLFLKEDALQKGGTRQGSQTTARPKAKTLEVVSTSTRESYKSPSLPASLINAGDNAGHSGSDASQMNANEAHTLGPVVLPSSAAADVVPSPLQSSCSSTTATTSIKKSLSSCDADYHVPTAAAPPVVIQIHADKDEPPATSSGRPGENSPTGERGDEFCRRSGSCPLSPKQAHRPHLHIPDWGPTEMSLCQIESSAVVATGTLERGNLGPLDNLELPESPAYRSPLLSDSEEEEEGEVDEAATIGGGGGIEKKSTAGNSSRHHVLEAFVGSAAGVGEEPGLRHRLLSNLVNKRSESDGIVCMDRPRADRPVRRCESIDDGLDLMGGASSYQQRQAVDLGHMSFPQNIKTVTPATILKGPEDYTAGLGETVYLRAHYFGNPEPRVAWFRSGRRLTVPTATDTETSEVEQRIRIRTYPGESTLVIRDLRADDSGKYEIQIENEVGSDACSASLCVEGPPEPPGGRPYITTIDRDLLRLTLAWYGSTFDGGSMLTGYIVEMSSWPIVTDAAQPEPTDWTVVSSKCHSTSYIVRELATDREYIFRVRAQNIHGQSAPGKVSEPVSFNKSEDEEDGLLEDEEGNQRGSEADKGDTDDEEEFESPFEHRHVVLEEGAIFKATFEIYEELGRGRFGVVFKVKNRETREIFAAKFVKCRKQEERDKCKEEIEIMNGLDHSRLLQLAAAYENPREVIMIMEFIGGGELFEKVVADDFTLTEHDCVLFTRQICAAIGYMHHKDIVHLDLKPENILCKSKKSHQIKIIDFGLTRKLKPGEDVRILFGTPEFVSPEVISYEPVSAASDMWSVGVVCYVLLSGLSPFMGDSDVETFSNITGLCYDFEDDAFEHISEDAKDFILNLLVKDQRKRLKALECLKHPWLNQRQSDRRAWKEINTDKLKSFLMRRRWQKAAHAIRALGRFTSLGFRQDSKDSASSISGLSTQSADF